MKLALLTAAFVATCYAAVAFLIGFDSDCTVGIILALLALGGIFVIDHREHERERMAHGWDAAWRRRIEEFDAFEMDEADELREVD